MAQSPNLTDLERHAREELDARTKGDALAATSALFVRAYVPSKSEVVVPERWCIIAPQLFEVESGGVLELQTGAVLEVLR